MAEPAVQVRYDQEGDVLYISLGDPVPNYCREDPEVEGLHLVYSFSDNHLCGATVVWYSAQDLPTLKAKVPFKVDWPEQVAKDYPPLLTTEQTVDRIADELRGYLQQHPDAELDWVWRFGHDVGRDDQGNRTDAMNGTATFTLKVNGGVMDNGYTEEEKALLDGIEADPDSFGGEHDKEEQA